MEGKQEEPGLVSARVESASARSLGGDKSRNEIYLPPNW